MADSPTFQIPKDVIQPIIEAQITSAVLAAMQPTGRALEQAIATVLTAQVDSDGAPSRYNNGKPWVEWVVGDCIRKAARAAIEQHLQAEQPKIRAAIASELSKRGSPLAKQLIEGMVSALLSETTLKYHINVTAGRP